MTSLPRLVAESDRGVRLDGTLTAAGPDGDIVITGEGARVTVDIAEAAAGATSLPPGFGRKAATDVLDVFVKLSDQTVDVRVGGEPAVSFEPGPSLFGRILGLRECRPVVHSFGGLRKLLGRGTRRA